MAYKITEHCVQCGGCYYECPEEAVYEGGLQYHIDPDKCTECGTCLSYGCPAFAIVKDE